MNDRQTGRQADRQTTTALELYFNGYKTLHHCKSIMRDRQTYNCQTANPLDPPKNKNEHIKTENTGNDTKQGISKNC